MSYADIVICVGPLPILETWPPIYRGQERMVRDRLRVSQNSHYVYFRYAPCLTDFTFEFIRRPTSPILSPSYWTFVKLTLVTIYPTYPNSLFLERRTIYVSSVTIIFRTIGLVEHQSNLVVE
jgi:hypothetical protein